MYYTKTVEEIFSELDTSEKGLTKEEALTRLKRYGPNLIQEKKKLSPIIIFLSQFKSFIVYILIASVIISFILGETQQSIAIIVVLLIIGLAGFLIEYKAEKSIEALKKLMSQKVKVIRNNKKQVIDAKELVPGDIILLEVGDKVPADSRLITSINLETQESSLTGESTPVKKDASVINQKVAVADQRNMVFSGTTVTNGRAKAVVVATGMNTEIGKIAEMIQREENKQTPLQKKLTVLGKSIGTLTIIISIIVFITGILRGGNVKDIFLASVALAVAAIPEGLPAVVTICLGLGTQRMAKRNALIRKLPSVETLGSTTVICTDKTGTITCDEMTVSYLYTNKKIIKVTGSGYEPVGEFLHNGKEVDKKEIELLLSIGALNNNSTVTNGKVVGDPTEAALIISALKAGISKDELETKFKRVGEIGFSSERKLMTTIHEHNREKIMYTKGAPEVVLRLCNKIYENGKIRYLTIKDRQRILEINRQFASSALRVLAFAYKPVLSDSSEHNLTFVGLQAMIDPPRPEIKDAIAKCNRAGIRVVMITGDHAITAKAIAQQVGLRGSSITGEELEKTRNLERIVDDVSVYARVNPEHKMKIIDALKKKGHIVAMTGDGVNDAPALKKADIGIAMGITGTDVSKEAADVILTDDNFASIVNAVEEGRTIYDNIKKFVNYLLSSNVGEVLVLFIAMIIGFRDSTGALAVPLLALQILWINLITDTFPALALGVDPPTPNVMLKKPRDPKENIISKNMALNIFTIGVLLCAATLLLFSYYLPAGTHKARTIAFTALVVFEIVRVQMIRQQYNLGIFSNKWLIAGIIAGIFLQLIVLYTPLDNIFGTVPIGIVEWSHIVLAAIIIFVIGYYLNIFIRNLTNEAD